MTQKFGRKYKLTIHMDGEDEEIIIQNPFTIQFDIQRSTMSTLNEATFFIYNLGQTIRDRIFKDFFDPTLYHEIRFEAGYDNQMFTCFVGNIYFSRSRRENTEIVTEIHAKDGLFDTQTTQVQMTMAGGTKMTDLAKAVAKGFPHIDLGAIGNISDTFKRPVSVSGNSWEQLVKYLGNDVHIDSGYLNILAPNEAVYTDEIPVFNAATGLLESPIREKESLSIRTIFSPQVKMGQIVEVDATVLKNYNGQYKVIGLHHAGTISDAVGGECTSSFDLLVGGQLFGQFSPVKETAK